jgi:hypothetical protein
MRRMHTDLNQATSDFCPALTELLETRKAVGRTGRIYEGLAALSTVNNLHVIRELMRETRAPRTLEIGLSFGGSALVFCQCHKELGRPSGSSARHARPSSDYSMGFLRTYSHRAGRVEGVHGFSRHIFCI